MSKLSADIYDCFLRQTKMISNEMYNAKNTGLGIQEESITDILLNNIQSEHKENFCTKKFSHKDEANISGADWIWCIGEPGCVNHLLYNRGKQYAKLIYFSKVYKFIPKYSIYTKIDDDMSFYSREVPELNGLPPECWSFTAVAPKHIRNLSKQNERKYSRVLQFSVPWLYVFNGEKSHNAKLAEIVAMNLEKLYWSFENVFRNQQNKKSKMSRKYLDSENPEPIKMITETIPLPVLYLITNKIPTSFAPVSNVGILSNIPINLAVSMELKRLEDSRKWDYFQKTFVSKLESLKNEDIN